MRLGLVYILKLYFIPGVIFIAFLIPLSIYFDLFPLVLIIRGEIVWEILEFSSRKQSEIISLLF